MSYSNSDFDPWEGNRFYYQSSPSLAVHPVREWVAGPTTARRTLTSNVNHSLALLAQTDIPYLKIDLPCCMIAIAFTIPFFPTKRGTLLFDIFARHSLYARLMESKPLILFPLCSVMYAFTHIMFFRKVLTRIQVLDSLNCKTFSPWLVGSISRLLRCPLPPPCLLSRNLFSFSF